MQGAFWENNVRDYQLPLAQQGAERNDDAAVFVRVEIGDGIPFALDMFDRDRRQRPLVEVLRPDERVSAALFPGLFHLPAGGIIQGRCGFRNLLVATGRHPAGVFRVEFFQGFPGLFRGGGGPGGSLRRAGDRIPGRRGPGGYCCEEQQNERQEVFHGLCRIHAFGLLLRLAIRGATDSSQTMPPAAAISRM